MKKKEDANVSFYSVTSRKARTNDAHRKVEGKRKEKEAIEEIEEKEGKEGKEEKER